MNVMKYQKVESEGGGRIMISGLPVKQSILTDLRLLSEKLIDITLNVANYLSILTVLLFTVNFLFS